MAAKSSAVKLYFIRHGESQANAEGVIAGSTDVLLTERGIEQAREVAEVILLRGIQIDTIISSTLSRAYDTAKIIAEAVGYSGAKIIAIDELQEKGAGSFEGCPINVLYAANDEEMRQAGAESFADFAKRVEQANKMIEKHARGTTLIVGHAGIYRMAQVLYYKLPPSEMKNMARVPNGELKEYPLGG